MDMRKTAADLHAGRVITATEEIVMERYRSMVLARIG